MVSGLTCALSRQLSTTYGAAAAAEPARVVAAAEVGAAPAGPTRARLRPSAAMANPVAVVVNLPRFMMFPRSCSALLAYTKDDPGRARVAAFLNNFGGAARLLTLITGQWSMACSTASWGCVTASSVGQHTGEPRGRGCEGRSEGGRVGKGG